MNLVTSNSVRTTRFQFIGILVLLAAVLTARATVSGLNTFDTDFIWSIQLLNRLTHGEVLYRDMFFGATPLSIYLLQALSRVTFGVESLTLLCLILLCQFTLLASCAVIASRTGNVHPWLFVLLLLSVSHSVPVSPYNPLAIALAGLTWAGTMGLVLTRRDLFLAWWSLFWLGVAIGLCFSAKQNTGILIAVAVTLSLAYTYWSIGWKRLVVAAGVPLLLGFVLPIACCLVPVFVSGGLPEFLDFAFLGKVRYLECAGISWIDTVRHSIPTHYSVENWRDLLRYLKSIVEFGIQLLPIGTGLAVAIYWLKRPDERHIVFTVAIFALMILFNVYPRANFFHMQFTTSILFTVMWISLARIGLLDRLNKRLVGALCIVVMGNLIMFQVRAWLSIASEEVTVSAVHPYRWIPVKRRILDNQLRDARELFAAVRANPTFLLFYDAARYYLLTGIRNPTPFDYPLATVFGRNGEQQLIQTIEAGRLRLVCVGSRYPDAQLDPEELLVFVEKNMDSMQLAGPCLLYGSPFVLRDHPDP